MASSKSIQQLAIEGPAMPVSIEVVKSSRRAFKTLDVQLFIETLSFGQIALDVNRNDEVADLKKVLIRKLSSDFAGYDIEHALNAEYAATWLFESKIMKNDHTLADYSGILRDATIRSTFGLLGGVLGGVIKKHLKKSEAVILILDKTKEAIARDLKPAGQAPANPAILSEFTKQVDARIDFLRTLRNTEGDDKIQRALDTFSDEKLTALKEVLEQKRSVLPEVKLQKLGALFLQEFDMMEECENHIGHKRLELMNAFVDLYGKELISEKNGKYCYEHEKLLKEVITVQTTRVAIARMTRSQGVNSSEAGNAPQLPDAASRCVVC